MPLFCVNLFSGPCAGKSVLASDLFSAMKRRHLAVENTVEAAKDIIWDGREHALVNQISVLGEQWNRIWRLDGKVDIAITDSPVLLCSHYAPQDYPPGFHDLAWWCHHRFHHINFFVTRQDEIFEPTGRVHNLEEAKIIDLNILRILAEANEPVIVLPKDDSRLQMALEKIGEATGILRT